MYFLFSKAGNFETSNTRVPYNKLLTNLACSSRTGEYWPSVVFVQTSLRSVRTATTSGQYSPVRPSRSVSKRLLFTFSSSVYKGNAQRFLPHGTYRTFVSHLARGGGRSVLFLAKQSREDENPFWKKIPKFPSPAPSQAKMHLP